MRTLIILLLLATPAAAQGLEETLEKIRVAHESGDESALQSLARETRHDPWSLADRLCQAGHRKAAAAFAELIEAPDAPALRRFIEGFRLEEGDRKARVAIYESATAMREGRFDRMLEILGDVHLEDRSVVAAVVVFNRALALLSLRRYEESRTAFLEAASIGEDLGWLRLTSMSLHRAGLSARRSFDYRTAIEDWTRMLEVSRRRTSPVHLASNLTNLGEMHYFLQEYEASLELQERALAAARAAKSEAYEAKALLRMGTVRFAREETLAARELFETSLRISRRIRDAELMVIAEGNLANVLSTLGDLKGALAAHERLVGIFQALDSPENLLNVRLALGGDLFALGRYAEALEQYHRAERDAQELGQTQILSRALRGRADVRSLLGDEAGATPLYEKSIALIEDWDRANLVAGLQSLGRHYSKFRAYAEAIDCLERARQAAEDEGLASQAAACLTSIAVAKLNQGDPEAALEACERAKAACGDDDPANLLSVILATEGNARIRLDEPEPALEAFDAALRATDPGRSYYVYHVHACRASALLLLDRPGEALDAARSAMAKLPELLGGFDDELSARAHGQFTTAPAIGVAAALETGDAAAACECVERARATALIELIGSRDALAADVLPADLLEEERQARGREKAAASALRRAMGGRDDAAVVRASEDLTQAREKHGDVVGRIQRQAKTAASVLYPKPAGLAELRALLKPDEALVVYALFEDLGEPYDRAAALVVTPDRTRIVRLDDSVRSAGAAFRVDDPGFEFETDCERLRDLLVQPLGLDEKVRRVLVSPDGPLVWLPFSLLFPGRDVACIPSGSTWKLLREQTVPRYGEGVLALGAPETGTGADPIAQAIRGPGVGLPPLESAAEEAKNVGTRVLLGKEATEAALREEGGSRRWRSIHLACHGLLDSGRPMLSSLALTPSGNDDGFLTVLDVFRLELDTDLVVLSACRTGRGQVMRGEGLVGPVRGFLFAGAPRVIASLWKVDDEATRALMEKFYEIWLEGGVSTAAALRLAQRHVRSRPGWEHPYYWAAWVLWGLPD